jgi:hypothetical protein
VKFYRLTRLENCGVNVGFEYFTTKREAEKAFRDWMSSEDEEWVCSAEGTKIEIIDVEPGKYGILRALNKYASHPDNG